MKAAPAVSRANAKAMIKAAFLYAAIFFTLAVPASAQGNYDKEIDTAIDAFAFAGKLGGVDVGDAGKALLKGTAKCVANDRPVLECARDYLVEHLPERAKPMAKCLIQDLGNIDRNIGKCALETAAPLLSKQIPPEVLSCVINNPANDAAKCAADTAVKAAIDKAMANVPPDVRRMAQCVTKLEKAADCDVLPPQVKAALEAADKLKNEVNTASNIIKVAAGIKNDDWDEVFFYGGAEVYKVAAKIVLNALLTPWLAPIIGPAVDSIVDSRVQLVTDLIKALKQKHEALVLKIAAEFLMYEKIRLLCVFVPNDVKEATCGEVAKGISKVGDVLYGALTCKALKEGNVLGDTYQFGCGAANDAADIAWDGAEMVWNEAGKGLKTTGKIFKEIGEGFGKGVDATLDKAEQAFNAVEECDLGKSAGAVCKEFKKKLSDAGDAAKAVVNAPASAASWLDGIFGPDKDERRANSAECASYARRAVDQANRARQQTCGSEWGTDYNGHYNWCMTVRLKTANSESRLRDESLNKCDACRHYTLAAANDVRIAAEKGCSFPPTGTWSTDSKAHFQFCMATNDDARVRAERDTRASTAARCDACRHYTLAAANDVRIAAEKGCSFPPTGRWSRDSNAHFQFCLATNDDAVVRSERDTRARTAAICVGPPPPAGVALTPGRPPIVDRVPTIAPPPTEILKPPRPPSLGVIDPKIEPARPQSCRDGMEPNADGRCVCPSDKIWEGRRCITLSAPLPPPSPRPPPVPCQDGSRVPAGTPCPPPKVTEVGVRCPDDTRASHFELCRKRCPDGAVVRVREPCPKPTPTPTPKPAPPRECTGGMIGTPPNCKCRAGTSYQGRLGKGRCVPTSTKPSEPTPKAPDTTTRRPCPPGTTGRYPRCHPVKQAPKQPQTCPNNHGRPPTCSCPTNRTGPNCDRAVVR